MSYWKSIWIFFQGYLNAQIYVYVWWAELCKFPCVYWSFYVIGTYRWSINNSNRDNKHIPRFFQHFQQLISFFLFWNNLEIYRCYGSYGCIIKYQMVSETYRSGTIKHFMLNWLVRLNFKWNTYQITTWEYTTLPHYMQSQNRTCRIYIIWKKQFQNILEICNWNFNISILVF